VQMQRAEVASPAEPSSSGQVAAVFFTSEDRQDLQSAEDDAASATSSEAKLTAVSEWMRHRCISHSSPVEGRAT